jgi:Type II restriction endonuclease, TdeIII
MDELTTGTGKPNKRDEIERIRKVATSGSIKKCKRPRVDVFLVANDGAEYYIDLKTAKPNMEEFKGFKRKLTFAAAHCFV